MQKIIGYMRRAVADYNMLKDGDVLAAGLSGGKDSSAMLAGLLRLRQFMGIKFDIIGVTVDPCFNGAKTDYSELTAMCEAHGVRHVVRRSDLGDIIFNQRAESNPCSLCARMRRGMLHDLCNANGANKLALGHHRDDAVETFVMNLFHEGRLGCFQPVTYLSRKDITMVRPLIYATEKDVRSAVKRNSLPVVKSKCPVDGATAREKTKHWLAAMEKSDCPGLSKKIYGAIKRAHLSGW